MSIEGHLGQLGGHTPRVTGQLIRAADATGAYAAGDAIAQSTTGSTNTPIQFTVARNGLFDQNRSGRLTGCRCTVTAASGTVVLQAFDLLLFRPNTSIPFAAGSYAADNAAVNISAAAYKELVAVFSFSDSLWRNQAAGATAAGGHVWQAVGLSVRPYAPFNLLGLNSVVLNGIMQSTGTQNPGNVQQTYDFVLDVDQD